MTVLTRAELNDNADTFLPDNSAAEISPADLRDRVKDLADSALMAEDLPSIVRELLTSHRTYFVRTDGSDSNDGLANTSAGAFLTVQKAVDVARALDAAIYTVTISVGAGGFPENLTIGPMVGGSSAPLVIVGAGYASTTIGAGSGTAVNAVGGAIVKVGGFTIAAGASNGINAETNASVSIDQGTIAFAGCSGAAMIAADGGRINQTSDIRVSGNVAYIWRAARKGIVLVGTHSCFVPSAISVTATCKAAQLGIWQRGGMITFDLTGGSVTGKRHEVDKLGLIDTAGQANTYFPGSVAGTDGVTGGLFT